MIHPTPDDLRKLADIWVTDIEGEVETNLRGAIRQAADRIEALEAQNLKLSHRDTEWGYLLTDAAKRIEALDAKLAIAVNALEQIMTIHGLDCCCGACQENPDQPDPWDVTEAALKTLKGT